ncbi:MAG: hypothetical protein ACTS4Z_00085 [Candidatus Hodgkinia cicadicola]
MITTCAFKTLQTKLTALVCLLIPIIIDHEFVGVIDTINMLAMFWGCKTSPHKLRSYRFLQNP